VDFSVRNLLEYPYSIPCLKRSLFQDVIEQRPFLLSIFLLTAAALPKTLKTLFSNQTVQALFRASLHKNLLVLWTFCGTSNLTKLTSPSQWYEPPYSCVANKMTYQSVAPLQIYTVVQ
jgi:hypothetical protein